MSLGGALSYKSNASLMQKADEWYESIDVEHDLYAFYFMIFSNQIPAPGMNMTNKDILESF